MNFNVTVRVGKLNSKLNFKLNLKTVITQRSRCL